MEYLFPFDFLKEVENLLEKVPVNFQEKSIFDLIKTFLKKYPRVNRNLQLQEFLEIFK